MSQQNPNQTHLFAKLANTVQEMASLHSGGVFDQMEPGAKQEYFQKLIHKKREIEAMLGVLSDVQKRSPGVMPGVSEGSVDQEEEELYENTSKYARQMAQMQASSVIDDIPPPPLPPRLPRRSAPPTNTPTKDKQKTNLQINSSQDNSDNTLTALLKKRQELSSFLEQNAKEKTDLYLKLENTIKNLNSVKQQAGPLDKNYSVSNERERQKLEFEADHLRHQIETRFGNENSKHRQYNLAALKEVESRINELSLPNHQGLPNTFNSRSVSELSTMSMQRKPPPAVPTHNPPSNSNRSNLNHHRSANLEQLYHESIPTMNRALSHSGPSAIDQGLGLKDDTASVISFTSSIHSLQSDVMSNRRKDDIDSKIECVDSMVALLGCKDIDKLSLTFEAMSSSRANCEIMRANRALEALVQIQHTIPLEGEERPSREIRLRVARALHNIVHAHPTDKQCKREAKVLKLLETLRLYADFLRDLKSLKVNDGSASGGQQELREILQHGCRPICIKIPAEGQGSLIPEILLVSFGDVTTKSNNSHVSLKREAVEKGNFVAIPSKNFINFSQDGTVRDGALILCVNIEETLAVLTRCSFDESHRQPISLLGGIRALAELIQVEGELHNANHQRTTPCSEVRRYAVVALTNLTFGNASIKSFLCSYNGFVPIMVSQLDSPFENLRKATAHLFRNLAWKADKKSKHILSESNVVVVLMRAAIQVQNKEGKEEPTLKVILSALWNLSAHCGKNKADICSLDGSLPFLVSLLTYKSVAIVENGGGILRNISSYIATCDEGEKYRTILRENNCLSVLLNQLTSPSLTIVSNACGTLWNFSARCPEDQQMLWELGAVPMLKSLTSSKHKTIATCSAAALKNLTGSNLSMKFLSASSANSSREGTPSLDARRRKNMVLELDEKLTETSEHLVDTSSSDSESGERVPQVTRSGPESETNSISRDSVRSCPVLDNNNPGFGQSSKQQAFGGNSGYFKGQQEQPNKSEFYSSNGGRNNFAAQHPMVNNYVDDEHSGTEQVVRTSSFGLRNDHHILSPSQLYGASAFQHQQQEEDEEDVKSDEGDQADERPTDYSARFKDSEDHDVLLERDNTSIVSNEGSNASNANNKRDISDENPDCGDMVKTYCTEGTPFDTPCMISNANSMSDLHDHQQGNKNSSCGLFNRSDGPKPEDGIAVVAPFSHGLRSGLDTPLSEQPMAFCTEDTPGYFSRADSLSSLETEDVNPTLIHPMAITDQNGGNHFEKGELEARASKGETPPLPEEEPSLTPPQQTSTTSASAQHHHQSASKSVTFNPQETPLMFSRASSFESLNSFYQHSIRDGYSSCDFSRTTTRPVSPSDLPDSPCQTRPHSPRRQQQRNNNNAFQNIKRPLFAAKISNSNQCFPPIIEQQKAIAVEGSSDKPAACITNTIQKEKGEIEDTKNFVIKSDSSNPCYDDDDLGDGKVRVYGDEGTPGVFSSKTSLSKLTFTDDEEERPELALVNGGRGTINQVGISNQPDANSRNSDEEEIYEECLLSKITEQGMPTKRNESSRPSSRTDGRRSRSSGIPVRPSASRVSTNPKSSMPRQLQFPAQQQQRQQQQQQQHSSPSFLDQLQKKQKLIEQKEKIEEFESDSESNKSDGSDVLESIVQSGMRSGKFRSTSSVLGTRIEGEGAPAPSPTAATSNPSKSSTSLKSNFNKKSADLKANNPFLVGKRSKVPPPPPKRLGSALSPTPLNSSANYFPVQQSSRIVAEKDSCSSSLYGFDETPKKYTTEDTPNVFSRNDSFSSLSDVGDENEIRDLPSTNDPCFLSHIPRPEALGRSESSGSSSKSSKSSSTGYKNKNKKKINYDDVDEEISDDEDDEFLSCINSGMPKSKSMPLNLKSEQHKQKIHKKKSPRSKPNSKRNSKIIPGVRISELKLKPKSTEHNKEEQDDKEEERETTLVVEDIEKEEEIAPNAFESLTSSELLRESEIVTSEMDHASMGISVCSNLDSIQPPSIMDSLISISEKIEPPSNLKSPALKHKDMSLSGKRGSAVPEVVRRALGRRKSSDTTVKEEVMTCSDISCNLDNIQPPSLMDDMNNSLISLDSLTSEVADGNDKVFNRNLYGCSMAESRNLDDIAPPSAMDEVSGALTTRTLVASPNEVDGGTYVIEGHDDAGQSTCQDVTDVFDDDTLIEPTLESDKDLDDTPDLPRDSRHGTPSHSSTENSPRKKNIDCFKKFQVPVPNLDDSFDDIAGHDTSGYKSGVTTTAGAPTSSSSSPKTSSRLRRKEDLDRFKTHVITQHDLSPQRSPKTIKQKREEEPDRFKTHVITQSDLKSAPPMVDMSPMEVKLIQDDANLIASEAKKKAKMSTSSSMEKSRSVSLELLDDIEMNFSTMTMSGSQPSLAVESPKKGPRITKPNERKCSEEQQEPLQQPGIRGRRKPLYSSPQLANRNNVSNNKPAIAPKPKFGRGISSPGQNRKQLTVTKPRLNSGSSSGLSPKPFVRAISSPAGSSVRSSASSTRSNVSRSAITPKPMIRQRTFTKDDSSSNYSEDSTTKSSKSAPKPSIRRDVVHPVQGNNRIPNNSTMVPQQQTGRRNQSPRILHTKTSQLRESSSSRNATRERNLSSTSSNSSLASARSNSRSAIPVSRSNQNLKSVASSNTNGNHQLAMSQRFPSTPKVYENDNNDTSATNSTTSPSKKKDTVVSSKIANLWKKVEESKKAKEKEKDKRVWITQGKVIPETDLAFLREHQEQREIIKNFQASKASASNLQSNNNLKPRTKSRLSMKLSKFSSKSKSNKDLCKSPVSPPQLEDLKNGNSISDLPKSDLVDSALKNNKNYEEEEEGKILSRLNSFVTPEAGDSTSTLSHKQSVMGRTTPASAVVTPFNYSPPNKSSMSSAVKTPSSAQIRRNDSYVSSMGRKGGPASDLKTSTKPHHHQQPPSSTTKNEGSSNASSSVLVTLV